MPTNDVAAPTQDLQDWAVRIKELRERALLEVSRVVVGMDRVAHRLLIALLAGGHVLLEGVPGIAKTTLSKTFARVLGTQYQRVQFTPDLLPSDVTGTYVFDRRTNEFLLRKGPVFCNVLLADEVNRAPAKTQSALLEAMQENQVTIEGTTLQLPSPFMVLATLCLLRCARARALLDGRHYFTHEDVHAVAQGVFGHRLIVRPEAEVDGKQAADVVRELLEIVPVLETKG